MNRFRILLLAVWTLSNSQGSGQCSLDKLFPVKVGISKFQAINTLNLQNNISEVRDLLNYWSQPDYLKGDSIFESQVNFKFKTHTCVHNTNNIVLLSFADKKLYKITLRIWFKPNEFNQCLVNYDQILESLKIEYPYYKHFISSNRETDEQIGEGFWMYRSQEEEYKDKFEMISIEYKMEHEIIWNKYTDEMVKTGTIDKYLLEITFVNLKNTKFDSRGY
jgi:hypothetical protein